MGRFRKWTAVLCALGTICTGSGVPVAAEGAKDASLTVLYGLGDGSLVVEHNGKRKILVSDGEQKVLCLEGKEGDEVKILAAGDGDLVHRLTVYERGGDVQEYAGRPQEEVEAVFTMTGDVVAEAVYADPVEYNEIAPLGTPCGQGAFASEGAAGMASFALTQLHTPYVWNTQGFGSYDCSGLVSRAAWAIGWMEGWNIGSSVDGWNSMLLGKNVPHEDIDLSRGFDPNAHPTKRGDIIIFMKAGFGPAIHMAIMLDNDAMVGAINGQGAYAGVSNALPVSQWYQNSGLLQKDSACARIFHFDSRQETRVRVKKKSAQPEGTDGNDMYSMDGAEYTVYRDRECHDVATVVRLDRNGDGLSDPFAMPNGNRTQLFAKETKAPVNGSYRLDGRVIPFYVENGSGSFAAMDVPVNDPMHFRIAKLSEDGKIVKETAPLAGAQFTVKYYKGNYSTAEELNKVKPAKTWILETKETKSGTYEAVLDDDHKVGGDDFYRTASGTPIVYLGTLSVEETKAPVGYTLEGAMLFTVDGKEVVLTERKGPAVFKITHDKGNVCLHTGTGVKLDEANIVKQEKALRGSLKLQKKDSEIGADPQGGAVGLSAGFTIHNDNTYAAVMRDEKGNVLGKAEADHDFDYEIRTDENGIFTSSAQFLPAGRYTIRETRAPQGYLGTDRTHSFEIKEGKTTEVCLNVFANAVIRGGFLLQKHDLDTGVRPQGNTDLKISFRVISDNENCVRVNGRLYKKGEVVLSGVTNEKGVYRSREDLLPYGSYTLEETVPPHGYTSAGRTSVRFKIENDREIVSLTHGEIANVVQKGSVRLHKTLSGTEGTNWTEDEQGAVFGIVKTAYARKHGSVRDALAYQYDVPVEKIMNRQWLYENLFALSDIADTTNKDGADMQRMTGYEYAVIRTDKTGMARTGEKALAFGSYTVAQLASGNDEIAVGNNPIRIEIDGDGKEIGLQAANVARKYRLRLLKKDDKTGKDIVFESATFRLTQVKDRDGKPMTKTVKQKVGSRIYDRFRTASEHGAEGLKPGTFYAAQEDGGSVTLPLALDAGTYRIDETEVPPGYQKIDAVYVKVGASTITQTDEDDEPYVTVTLKDPRRTAEFALHKKIEEVNADTDLLPKDILEQIEFTLAADEDIQDPSDGSILVHKGDPACDIYGRKVGVFHLDKNGDAVVRELPLGMYSLQETYVPEGLVRNDEVIKVDLCGKKGEPLVAHFDLELTNKPTRIELSKKDVSGDEELPGARITIIDAETGKVVDRYVSGTKPHCIKGLKRDHDYIMREEMTPGDGLYVKAEDIVFRVDENGKVDRVNMRNAMTKVRKCDEMGLNVAGAELAVYDESGSIVDRWISDGTGAHTVKGLIAGHTYTLTELKVPAGYVKFEDIVFTADGDHDQEIKVVNTTEGVEKKDEKGVPVVDAQLEVKDEAGNVIDRWVTGARLVDLDEATLARAKKNGEIFWQEEEKDYGLSYDNGRLELTVSAVDGGMRRAIVDEEGREVVHYISGLSADKAYRICETGVPDGFYRAQDLVIRPDGHRNHLHTVVDENVNFKIAKVDEKGDPVKGAKLKLEDITDPKHPNPVPLPNHGVTEEEPFMLAHVLTAGHRYRLTELVPADGFTLPVKGDLEFVVPMHGSASWVYIRFVNTRNNVSIMKVDENGDPLEGAVMAVLAAAIDPDTHEIKAEEEVTRFISTHEPNDISAYVKGDGRPYILREIEAPEGYHVIDDMVFSVNPEDAGKAKIMTAVDVRKKMRIKVRKVDREDRTKLLAGAEFTLYHQNGEVAKTYDGKDAIGVSGSNGEVMFEVECEKGMYVRETKAPEGYQLNSNAYPVHWDEGDHRDDPIEIVVADEKDTKTSVVLHPLLPLAAAVASSIAVCMLAVRTKRDA